jgi:hypothetical protein
MSNIINTLSLDLIQAYAKYQNLSSMKTDDLFKAVSLQVGGDGKSIEKETLDNYIKSASSDTADLSELKLIQRNWYELSKGEETITSENMTDKNSTKLLFSAVTSNVSSAIRKAASVVNSPETSLSSSDKIYSYLVDSAAKSSKGTSSSQYDLLISYLSELLSCNSDENSNSDSIDAVINMLAKMKEASMNTVTFTV